MLKPYFYRQLEREELSFIIDYKNVLPLQLHTFQGRKYKCNETSCLACNLWLKREYVYLYDIILLKRNENKILVDYSQLLWCNHTEHLHFQNKKKFYFIREEVPQEQLRSFFLQMKNNKKEKEKEIASYERLIKVINKETND